MRNWPASPCALDCRWPPSKIVPAPIPAIDIRNPIQPTALHSPRIFVLPFPAWPLLANAGRSRAICRRTIRPVVTATQCHSRRNVICRCRSRGNHVEHVLDIDPAGQTARACARSSPRSSSASRSSRPANHSRERGRRRARMRAGDAHAHQHVQNRPQIQHSPRVLEIVEL